jgi:chromosome segregation ATPase
MDGDRRTIPERRRLFMTLMVRYAIAILCVALIFGAGCSSYKAELENAKTQIVKLKAEGDRLTEQVSKLQLQKNKLVREVKELRAELAKLEAKAVQAEKAKTRLAKERDSLDKKNEKLQAESKALGKQVADLKKKNEELDSRVKRLETARAGTDSPEAIARQPEPTVSPAETKVLAESRAALKTQRERPAGQPRTACDAIIDFMRKAQGIVRQSKGEERARVLQKLKDEYEKQIAGAPKGAWKSALEWVTELSRAWDKTGGDSVYLLLRTRNQVLKACNMKPEEVGF